MEEQKESFLQILLQIFIQVLLLSLFFFGILMNILIEWNKGTWYFRNDSTTEVYLIVCSLIYFSIIFLIFYNRFYNKNKVYYIEDGYLIVKRKDKIINQIDILYIDRIVYYRLIGIRSRTKVIIFELGHLKKNSTTFIIKTSLLNQLKESLKKEFIEIKSQYSDPVFDINIIKFFSFWEAQYIFYYVFLLFIVDFFLKLNFVINIAYILLLFVIFLSIVKKNYRELD